MAPQILKEERYTYKCDIWSIGIIAYELLVGKVPWEFTSQNNLESFRQEILTRKVVIPEQLQVSDRMKDFIFGCICIDETKRFDWEKIFTHPIFGQRYSQNFSKEGSTKITFILTNFRMSLHSKNLNLSKILSRLGNKLNKNDFYNLVKMIYREITEEDVAIFFNYLAQKDGFVYINEFIEFLKKHQCRMTGINLSEKEMEMEIEVELEKSEKSEMEKSEADRSENFECESYKLMDRLRNSIEKGNLVIATLFKTITEKKLNF
jgi:serine/threonine protein kinase